MLELVDQMIDDIEQVSIPTFEEGSVPQKFAFAASMLPVLEGHFDPRDMPRDARRFADTVATWAVASGLDADGLGALLDRSDDLCRAASLDATSAVLGAFLREHREELISSTSMRFAISSELESLCAQASEVPADRRVDF